MRWWLLLVAGCGGKDLVLRDTFTFDSSETVTATTDPSTAPTETEDGALSVEITLFPEVLPVGELITVGVTATSSDPAPITTSWTSTIDGLLSSGPVDGAGYSEVSTTTLSPGWHGVEVVASQGGAVAVATTEVGVCEWPALEDFAAGASIDGWTVFGDAAWDPSGWLEITGNLQDRDGAIFLTERKVSPGNVTIEFDIATGGGINSGADGFVVSVIDAPDAPTLALLVDAAPAGGCLGAYNAGGCGVTVMNAFHIEFDTWHNPEYGDPTSSNHVAVALDGDPVPLLWTTVASLEDLQWRHVVITFDGSDVTVSLDGAVVIDGTLPGFTFDGGYIGVSGSTGWASNYHRFDNLQLFDVCAVPE